MALSAVYKEIAFRDRTVDVWYLCFWVSTYQFLVSFAFVPLLGVPFLTACAGGSEVYSFIRLQPSRWLFLLDFTALSKRPLLAVPIVSTRCHGSAANKALGNHAMTEEKRGALGHTVNRGAQKLPRPLSVSSGPEKS